LITRFSKLVSSFKEIASDAIKLDISFFKKLLLSITNDGVKNLS